MRGGVRRGGLFVVPVVGLVSVGCGFEDGVVVLCLSS